MAHLLAQVIPSACRFTPPSMLHTSLMAVMTCCGFWKMGLVFTLRSAFDLTSCFSVDFIDIGTEVTCMAMSMLWQRQVHLLYMSPCEAVFPSLSSSCTILSMAIALVYAAASWPCIACSERHLLRGPCWVLIVSWGSQQANSNANALQPSYELIGPHPWNVGYAFALEQLFLPLFYDSLDLGHDHGWLNDCVSHIASHHGITAISALLQRG